MAQKIVFGKAPKTIAHTVKVKGLDGAELLLPVTFTYRTASEFAAYAQAHQMGVDVDSHIKDGKFDLTSFTSATLDARADYIAGLLSGWGLDAEFGRNAIVQLCDEFPQAAEALIADYRDACLHGRLGN